MIRFIKDDDYDKIYNRYMVENINQGNFQSIHYSIYFKFYDGILDTETLLSSYINGLSIENNYEKDFTSIITVKLFLPSIIASRIIKLHNNKDRLKFYFKFVNSSPNLSKGIIKDITEKIDIMSDVLNNSFDNQDVGNNFNHYPYNDTPFIISDIKYQVPEQANIFNDVINNSIDAEADNMRAGFELTLYLINENAMNFSKTNMSFIINNATIDNIMYNMILKASTGLRPNSSSVSGNADSTFKYIEKPHNTNPNTQIMIDNTNVISTLGYLEENHGIYLTGHDYFIEGKYLYIGDKQSDNLLKNTDIYIEIVEKDIITALPNKHGMMLIEPPETESSLAEGLAKSSEGFNNSLYIICPYTSVMISNNEKVTRELSGDNLKVLYKTKEVDLKLPDSLQSTNYNNHYNVKTYEKKNDALFFESKLISDYSLKMGTITVVLTSVNPDIFHTGKQVILHFNNTLMSEIHNGKYKVLSKSITFNYGKRRTDLTPQITLILAKVLDYIPYDIDELTENLIYRYSTTKAEELLTTETDLKNKYINNQIKAVAENIKIELKDSFMFKIFNSNGVNHMYLNEHMKKTLPKLSEKVELIQKNFTTGKESVIEVELLKNYKRLMSLLNIIYAYVEGRWKYTVNGVSYNVYCNPYNSYRTQKEEIAIAKKYGLKENLWYSSQHMFGEAMDTHFYYGTEPNLKNRITDAVVIEAIVRDLFAQFGNKSKTELNTTASSLITTYNDGNRNIIQQIGYYKWGTHIGVVPDRNVGVIPGAYVFNGGY